MPLPVLEQGCIIRQVGRLRARPDADLAARAYSSRTIRSHPHGQAIKVVIPKRADQRGHLKRRGSRAGRSVGMDRGGVQGAGTVSSVSLRPEAGAATDGQGWHVPDRQPGRGGPERGTRVGETPTGLP